MIYQSICIFQSCADPVKLNTAHLHCLMYADDNKAGSNIKSKFIFHDVSIDCVSSYRYLGLYFSASGSFSYAKSELYKKGLKGYFKLCKNILNLRPSIKNCKHAFI